MRKVFYNHNHSGQFIWEKSKLIDLTFSQVLDCVADIFPDQCCIKYSSPYYSKTYKEFKIEVDNFARGLIAIGVSPGDKVAIWAPNLPEWFISFWSIVKIGAVAVPINTSYQQDELEYVLKHSDTHTLIMGEGYLISNYCEIVNNICPDFNSFVADDCKKCERLPFLKNVITIGYKMDGYYSYDDVISKCDQVSVSGLERIANSINPHTVCNIQYTSGTTGRPKGVMLSHYNIINNGKSYGDEIDLSTADRMLIHLPMFHCFGLVLSMIAAMTHGTTMCPTIFFTAASSLHCITNEHITCINGVPTMFLAMMNHPDYKKTDFSYMRTGAMAGTLCSPELMMRIAKDDEMHMNGIICGYGATESSPGCTSSYWDEPLEIRCNTIGHAAPYVECIILDPKTGEEVPVGQNGEFCSRGYNTMLGYYKDPDATAKKIDKNGWLHSGDLASMDDRGYFKITGRLEDMIIKGGENVYPIEIEDVLCQHNAIEDAQVVGVPDALMGEEIVAFVITKKDVPVSEVTLKDYVSSQLSWTKVPKYFIFIDSFPLNPSGKILKYKLREQAIKRIEKHSKI